MEASKSPNEKEIRQLVDQLREWLEQKSYVPKNADGKLYRRFVHSCYYDLDRAKVAADLFFSIRSSSPELFTDRDPLSPHMQKIIKITNLVHYRISGNRNLWIWQLDDPGLQQYDHLLEAKLFNLIADAWIKFDDFFEESDVIMTDAKDTSIKILMKYSYSIAKKMFRYQQEAFPIRSKEVHVVNAPAVMNKIFTVMKPFLNKELIEMIHYHAPKSTTLFDYLSRDELPEDLGGTRGKLADYFAETMAIIMDNREHLINDNVWNTDSRINEEKIEKVDKSRKVGKPEANELTESFCESSLQTLAED